jgi:carboxypeptidase Q
MIRLALVSLTATLLLHAPLQLHGQRPSIAAAYQATADSLIGAATRDSAAYARIGVLVDRFGHRLSGSPSLEAAIDWILAEMKKDGLQNVRGEPVSVTNWQRGQESAEMVRPRRQRLAMLGLGGSVGTPPAGITAPVLVVSSFEELERRRPEARGKIVLFDAPFTTYD